MIARDNHESDRLAVRVASRMHRPPGRSNAAPMCLAKQSGVSIPITVATGAVIARARTASAVAKANGHHPQVRALIAGRRRARCYHFK